MLKSSSIKKGDNNEENEHTREEIREGEVSACMDERETGIEDSSGTTGQKFCCLKIFCITKYTSILIIGFLLGVFVMFLIFMKKFN